MKKYKCNTCDYVYDEVKGEPEHGIQAMTAWADLPLEYVCLVCGVNKESFALYEEQTTIK